MIIFIYTTVSLIVLSTIPYKYDRFVKTEKEIEADAKKEEKNKKKKEKRKKNRKSKRVTERLTTALPNFTFGISGPGPVRPQSSVINGLESSPSRLKLTESKKDESFDSNDDVKSTRKSKTLRKDKHVSVGSNFSLQNGEELVDSSDASFDVTERETKIEFNKSL